MYNQIIIIKVLLVKISHTMKSETLTNLANQSQITKLQPFKVKPPSKISLQYKTKISAFTSILSTCFLLKFFELGFTNV